MISTAQKGDQNITYQYTYSIWTTIFSMMAFTCQSRATTFMLTPEIAIPFSITCGIVGFDTMSSKKQHPKSRPKIIRSQSSLSSIRSQSKHELSRMTQSMRDRLGYINSLYSASIPGMKTLRKLQSKGSNSIIKRQQSTSDQIWRTNRLVDAAVDGQSDNVKRYLSPEEKLDNVNGFHQVLHISALHGAARAGFVDIVEMPLNMEPK